MLEQVTIAAKTSEDRFSECGFFCLALASGHIPITPFLRTWVAPGEP
jgi:hypothetical protein